MTCGGFGALALLKEADGRSLNLWSIFPRSYLSLAEGEEKGISVQTEVK